MSTETKKQQVWKFATRFGFTRTIRPSTVIADQVVQGQAIRVRSVPALKIEFNRVTKQYLTRDPEVAKSVMADDLFRRKDNPKGQFWLVDGYPKTYGPDVSSEPELGPEPVRSAKDGPPIAKSGVRSTGRSARRK